MKRIQPLRLCAVAFTFLTLTAPCARAFWAPSGIELPNFDKRTVGADHAAALDHEAAVSTLKARVPGLQVYFDERLGTPKWIVGQSGFLSGPGASGLAISPQISAVFDTNDNYRATKAFLTEHQSLFGFGPEILSTARVTQDSVTAHNGLRTVVWEQDLGGIPVFEALLISHTTKQEELVNLSSMFIPNPAQAADVGTPNRAAILQSPQISASAAVNAALIDLGETVEPSAIAAVEPQSLGAEQHQHFTAPPLNGQADVKLVWLPLSATTLRLCWEVELTSRARGEMYRVLVDVQTGEVLVRHRLTEYQTDVSYRVYTSDSPSPFSPGCPTPCTTQPPLASRTLVTWPALNTNASPAGWIDDGGNETRGNNVDAHTDRDANDVADLPRPQGSPFRTFDFTLDLAQAPTAYTNAAVVELFYWNNWMHDKLYELGFTEAARNFQSNNFGRGGLGNDAVQADAQDGSGVNNANFSTPSDGSPGRMQMYVFTGPNPDRDGDLDHEVVLHEYTHGLSNRRVGGGVGMSAVQSRGMGEGWSDWYSLSLLSEPADDVNAVYAAGGYASYLFNGVTSNYYFGIRRYPYCTDMSKNPLTFKDIDPNQASTHPGIPRSPNGGTTADEVHNQGEVWCVTLWDARANIIAKYGYSVGNQLILKLVTDGMNLSPANPNFLQARDGILQADIVDNGGADLPELWAAFAKRGMGSGATSPSSSTTIGVVESYIVPDSLTVSPTTGFTSTGPVNGPFSPTSLNFILLNTGTNTINWAASQTAAWMNLSQTSGPINVSSSNLVTASLNSSAYTLAAGIYTNIVRFTNVTTGVTSARNFVLRVGQPDYFTELFDTANFDLDNQTLILTPDGSTNFYSVCREPAFAYATDPTGSSNLALGSHTFMQLTTPSNISIYGRSTNVIFLASEGHLTLIAGDSSGLVTLANHFSRPRVSASLAHIHPTENGGKVLWLALSNRVVITFDKVVEYATVNTNSFQIELFFDGRIRMTHLSMATTTGLVGISAGNGIPPGFIESDLSSYGPCALPMAVTVPHNATEGDGTLSGQINIFSAATTNVTFAVSCTATAQVAVPPSVTLLAGQTTTNFNIAIIDDAILDGPQSATITATAPGFAGGSDTVIVADNETATLTLSLPSAVTEGAGLVAGTITASAAPASNIVVNLNSSDTTELQVPAFVILLAGQTSIGFNASVIDDTLIDGDQLVTITAHVPNWTDATTNIVVHDNEPTNIVVTFPGVAREGNGTLVNAGTVRIFGTLTTNLIVSLLSSDTTELTVPPTMTILAGQTTGTFSPTVIDDTEIDGPQTVTVTASAFGFSSGATNMIVNDDESPPIPSNPSPPDLATNMIQTTGLVWSSGAVPGEIITNDVYFGTSPALGPAQLQGTTTGTSWTLLNLLPLTTYYWQIVARKAGVVPGPVWQFTTRGADHFVWDSIASPKYVNQPFTATVTAKDIFENTVSNFTGTVGFSASGGGQGEVFRANFESGLQGFTITNAVGTNTGLWHLSTGRGNQTGHSATHSIYYGQNEGPSGGGNYNTGLANEGMIVSPVIDLTGISGPLTLSFNCLIQSEPGTSWDHATVEVSTNNFASFVILASNNQGGNLFGTDSLGNWITVTNNFSAYAGRQVRIRFHFNTIDAGANGFEGWYVDDIVIGGPSAPLAISPTNSTPFNNGVWTGSITVQAPATNAVLRADDANGHVGSSSPFAVQLQNDISVAVTDSPDPVSLGANLTYNIVVANTGPDPATGVFVTNVLPATASLISATPSQGTVTTNGNNLIFDVGTIPGTASAAITIVVTPIAVGTMTDQTFVSRAEPDAYPPNNSAIVTTAVQTPTISINDVTLYEGNVGTTNAVFTVTVSPPPALPVSVNFATADNSAIAPGDYISTSGVLNFAPGETNKTIIVPVVGDTFYELNETFNVNLSSPSNATFADSLGIGTILNDDPIPTISISDATLVEGNAGFTNAVFTVSLSAPSGLSVQVNYATVNGNATGGSDYTTLSGSLFFAPGVTNLDVAVVVRGDLTIEPDEVFYVDLSLPSNANLLKREGYGLILNDDGLPGQVDHFVWNAIGPTQYVGTPFSATITALDSFNNPASAFNGNANLTASISGGFATNSILGNISYSSLSSGNYTLGYSFTPNTNLTVTHVRSYFGTKISIWTDAGALLASQAVNSPLGIWTETPLPTPLVLNAGTTYRVAAYTGGGTYYWRTDGLNSFTNGVINVGYEGVGDIFPPTTDTVRWWFVDLRYTTGTPTNAALTPAIAGPFVNGVWTGNVTAMLPATNVVVRADDGNAHSGLSNPFNVELRNDLSLSVTDSPDPVVIGGSLTNVVTVINSGPAAATSVTVTNFIPASASFISATPSQGTSALVSGHVECALGSIPGGGSATVTIVTTPNSSGLITNLFSIGRAEADPYPGNNSASTVATVIVAGITIADAFAIEGDSGQTNLLFAVRLSFPSPLPVSVNYATADFTAQAGSDYVATNGVLTFTYPETNKLIAVAINGDTNVESSESFFVNLSVPVNATLTRSQAIGSILNDDGCGLQTNYTSSQTILNSLSATVMTMAFDGTSYWECSGGSSVGVHLARYDIAGNLQSTYSPGLDFRSVFTDAAGNLYARAFGTSIIYRQTTPGVFTNYVTLGSGILDVQAAVVLNGTGTEFISMYAGVVSRWQTDGTFIGTVNLNGFGTVLGENVFPQNRAVAAEGNYWITYNGSGVISFWDATGTRVWQSTLQGANNSADSGYTFSYCNGKVFVMDTTVGNWFGYDVCGAAPPTPPIIYSQPVSQGVSLGGNAAFSVVAGGTSPLAYQWRKNAIAISGATGSSYVIAGVQTNHAGLYSVLVTNIYGSTLSSNAALNLIFVPTNVLAQGNLRITLNTNSAGITSVLFQSNEVYAVGTFISDWGLQTGTNSATFVRNANGVVSGLAMTRIAGDSRSSTFTGNYTAGGANVAVTRDYALLLGSDMWRTKMTFQNNGFSSITLRYFETFDVDWLTNGLSYVTTANDRYSINTNGASILIGRSVMTNGPLVVMLGTTDPGAIISATSPIYFGIGASANLNAFFLNGGWDDNGALRDATLDIGKEFVLAPGAVAAFVGYQSINTNIASAEWALVNNLATSQLKFTSLQSMPGGNLQLLLSTTDGSPISAERASHIQLYSSPDPAIAWTNWTPVPIQTPLNNGILQINGLNSSNAPARFYRAVESP